MKLGAQSAVPPCRDERVHGYLFGVTVHRQLESVSQEFADHEPAERRCERGSVVCRPLTFDVEQIYIKPHAMSHWTVPNAINLPGGNTQRKGLGGGNSDLTGLTEATSNAGVAGACADI